MEGDVARVCWWRQRDLVWRMKARALTNARRRRSGGKIHLKSKIWAVVDARAIRWSSGDDEVGGDGAVMTAKLWGFGVVEDDLRRQIRLDLRRGRGDR